MNNSTVDKLIDDFISSNEAAFEDLHIPSLARHIINLERNEPRENDNDEQNLLKAIREFIQIPKPKLDQFNSNVGKIKFRKIELTNFGPYQNQTIEFPNEEKSLILIIGGTGQGKTSIFNSISWVFTNLAKKKNGDPIPIIDKTEGRKQLLNWNSEDNKDYQMEVKVNFSFINNDGKEDKYEFSRRVTSKREKPLKDSDFESKLMMTSNNEVVKGNKERKIKELFPEHLIDIFLFDAENISEFVNRINNSEEQRDLVVGKIKKTLGIPFIEYSIKDLKSISELIGKDVEKESKKIESNNKINEKIDDLRFKLEKKQNSKKDFDEKINEIDEELEIINQFFSDNEKTSKLQGNIDKLKEEIDEKKISLDDYEKELREKIREKKGKDLINNILSSPIREKLKNAKSVLNKASKEKLKYDESSLKIKLIQQSIDDKCCEICNIDQTDNINVLQKKIEEINSFDSFDIKNFQKNEKIVESLESFELSDSKDIYISLERNINNLNDDIFGLQKELSEKKKTLDGFGLADGVKSEISKMTEKKASLSIERDEYDELLNGEKGVSKEVEDLEEEILKLDGELVTDSEEGKKFKLDQKITKEIMNYLIKLEESLVKNMKSTIQEKADEIYQKIKMKNYWNLEIDDNYGLGFSDGDQKFGGESAGETRQMMMSLIYSLGKSSEINAPVIMDNPLATLGTQEQEKMISSFDYFSEQTLLFLTTSEFQDEQRNAFDELNISTKKYTVSNISKGSSLLKEYD